MAVKKQVAGDGKGGRVTYDDPLKFIDDLAPQLAGRIAQLERRTRTRK